MRCRRTRGGTGPSAGLLAGLLTVWMVLAGCSSSAVDEAGQSDANGYVCLKCGAKFYTERKVFAEKCPTCQTIDIKGVVGFVCEKDQHMIIGPGGRDWVPCDQCGGRTSALRLPKESELKSWGAEKKTRKEILL